jgi:hypothetical protein
LIASSISGRVIVCVRVPLIPGSASVLMAYLNVRRSHGAASISNVSSEDGRVGVPHVNTPTACPA